MSRPCVYGVFSGSFGGFSPREKLCVGCLRCTTQYPDICTISHNPEYSRLGDSYFTPTHANCALQEAETGRVPIRGAGYRGAFGGQGWDGMWTDMSEIVRPTRDGLHGREYISTQVDIGEIHPSLTLDKEGQVIEGAPRVVSIPIPMIFDVLPARLQEDESLWRIFSEAGKELESLAVVPYDLIRKFSLEGSHIVPLVSEESHGELPFAPELFEVDGWNEPFFHKMQKQFPKAVAILRCDFESDLLFCYRKGVRVFHLAADYHGRGKDGAFILDLIRQAHQTFVKAKCRGEVTLLGSGGVIAAEHVPKAILCGLDLVALDTALLVALQGEFLGECKEQKASSFRMLRKMSKAWGKQRLKNLIGAWRDQLLEILGAMGLREVRRLRGEMGRALFQKELEQEAFGAIAGYAHQ
jgi:hypothetical protein